jgi:hypothetical protein
MRTVSSIIRLQEVLVALLHGGVLSRLLRRKATMDTLAALGWSGRFVQPLRRRHGW